MKQVVKSVQSADQQVAGCHSAYDPLSTACLLFLHSGAVCTPVGGIRPHEEVSQGVQPLACARHQHQPTKLRNMNTQTVGSAASPPGNIQMVQWSALLLHIILCKLCLAGIGDEMHMITE